MALLVLDRLLVDLAEEHRHLDGLAVDDVEADLRRVAAVGQADHPVRELDRQEPRGLAREAEARLAARPAHHPRAVGDVSALGERHRVDRRAVLVEVGDVVVAGDHRPDGGEAEGDDDDAADPRARLIAGEAAEVVVGVGELVEELVVYVGGTIRVADFATSGSEELGEAVIAGLEDRAAVLLRNHGVFTVGKDLRKAFTVATLIERAAKVLVFSKLLGKLTLLPEEVVATEKEFYTIMKGM